MDCWRSETQNADNANKNQTTFSWKKVKDTTEEQKILEDKHKNSDYK